MTKIDHLMIEQLYEAAKIYYGGAHSKSDAMHMVKNPPASIADFLYNYQKMRQGQLYRRTMSAAATDYFLENIYKDEGMKGLRIALISVEQHMQYYNNLPYGKLKKIQELLVKYYKYLELERPNAL
ncbi:MAG: hypothetical protein EAZ74_04735 [Alphaproteobacteria bacterium]|nr:MAG: hypothetical protein EAY76_03640 [Alphaproteobacteria bacterium]TAF14088.1 MAG: hypothetical protein EAZ74_04735 [Alphaproteobacteria bacterium]TAF41426.1 MAG: hypothetical protein EAZ66_01365 [Alphaproteobacteria bacterium]TAF75405.1 MAG: hypothetical protein EAZ52_06900 [Alphaproteobacteria bacterium]